MVIYLLTNFFYFYNIKIYLQDQANCSLCSTSWFTLAPFPPLLVNTSTYSYTPFKLQLLTEPLHLVLVY